MNYSRIENYPVDSGDCKSVELHALHAVWLEKRDELEETGVFQEFLKKLQREWAIETGIIERLYTWDRGVTEVLIEQGIDSSLIVHGGGLRGDEADHIKSMINDQLSIVEGLFSFVKDEQPLTEHFIRGMHAEFTNSQDSTEALGSDGRLIKVVLEKGVYKKHPNNPRRPDGEMHAYCPPELTQEEMGRLIRWYKDAENDFPTELRAAWLHHRFTQIHPFQDGNGRVARALASMVFLKDGFFPVVIRESDRKEYIASLEAADGGSLKELVDLFVRRQRDSILSALGLEQQVQQNKYAESIISSAIEVLKNKFSEEKKKRTQVYEYAEDLVRLTEERVNTIVGRLNTDFRELTPSNPMQYEARFSSAHNDSPKKHYFYKQIIEVAKKFKYFSNLDRYRAWVRLSIHTEENFEFIVSIHAYGHGDNGIMAVSALTTRRVPREEGDGTDPVNVQPAATDLFQFNYAEPLDSTKNRYSEWLESSLAMALAEWKRQLSA